MNDSCRARFVLFCVIVFAAGLALVNASSHAVLLPQPVQKKALKTRPTILTWNRVPVCLDASAPQSGGTDNADTLKWVSARRDVRASDTIIGLALQHDEVVLTLGSRPVTIGADAQGRPVNLGESSLTVWAIPDCDAPEYVFIAQRSDGHRATSRRWLFDPRRVAQPGEPAVIDFPGRYEADTVVSLRDNALAISNDAADGDEKTFQYHPAPVSAFARKGVAQKYITTIGRPNADFFRNGPASDTVLKSAGQEVFDLLRARTSVGKTRLFQGRYLIVEGAAAGDYGRHGAVVVDAIKDVSVFVLCDDEAIETGALVVASRSTASLERGGEEMLAALRFAGFNVTFDEGLKLVCDGECHEDRVLRR